MPRPTFPEVVEAVGALLARRALLDGELVVFDQDGCSDFELVGRPSGESGGLVRVQPRRASSTYSHLTVTIFENCPSSSDPLLKLGLELGRHSVGDSLHRAA